jgi:hypothetical protein
MKIAIAMHMIILAKLAISYSVSSLDTDYPNAEVTSPITSDMDGSKIPAQIAPMIPKIMSTLSDLLLYLRKRVKLTEPPTFYFAFISTAYLFYCYIYLIFYL